VEGSEECKELTREEMESESEHREVPKEEAAVMPVGGLRKQCRDRNLAVERRQKPKGRIQASCEFLKRLTVAGIRMTLRARVTWHKRNIARANVVQEIWRGRMFGRRRQPKCSKGIRSHYI
jgi:hypothetical protein